MTDTEQRNQQTDEPNAMDELISRVRSRAEEMRVDAASSQDRGRMTLSADRAVAVCFVILAVLLYFGYSISGLFGG
jgi:type VI protein secretion system component VasF